MDWESFRSQKFYAWKVPDRPQLLLLINKRTNSLNRTSCCFLKQVALMHCRKLQRMYNTAQSCGAPVSSISHRKTYQMEGNFHMVQFSGGCLNCTMYLNYSWDIARPSNNEMIVLYHIPYIDFHWFKLHAWRTTAKNLFIQHVKFVRGLGIYTWIQLAG